MEKNTMTDPEVQQVEKTPEELTEQITVSNNDEKAIRKMVRYRSSCAPCYEEGRLMCHSVRPPASPSRLRSLYALLPRSWEHWSSRGGWASSRPQLV